MGFFDEPLSCPPQPLIKKKKKKKRYKLTYLLNRNRHTVLENKFMVTRSEEWLGGIDWEFGIDMYILCLKQIANKDLLHSTGSSAQYSVVTYIRKEFEKELIHTHTHTHIYI